MKINYTFEPTNSPKSFQAYPRGEFDLESGVARKSRKPKKTPMRMLKSLGNRIQHYYKLHPLVFFLILLSVGVTVLIILSIHEGSFRTLPTYRKIDENVDSYPLAKLRNLVMVAGHSVYTSSSCEKVDKENAWYLESYQKHPGQAGTFVTHIHKGVDISANDDEALLLFSGGETRKEAGPRSEAQSYWIVAESKEWFGKCVVMLCFFLLNVLVMFHCWRKCKLVSNINLMFEDIKI